MYCIECGKPIEASARICGACRFPQPLEEFSEVEQPPVGAGVQKPVMPVRFVDALPRRGNPARLTTALAAFVALCISTGLSVYLLTRRPSGADGETNAPASSKAQTDTPTASSVAGPAALPASTASPVQTGSGSDATPTEADTDQPKAGNEAATANN